MIIVQSATSQETTEESVHVLYKDKNMDANDANSSLPKENKKHRHEQDIQQQQNLHETIATSSSETSGDNDNNQDPVRIMELVQLQQHNITGSGTNNRSNNSSSNNNRSNSSNNSSSNKKEVLNITATTKTTETETETENETLDSFRGVPWEVGIINYENILNDDDEVSMMSCSVVNANMMKSGTSDLGDIWTRAGVLPPRRLLTPSSRQQSKASDDDFTRMSF